MAWRSTEKRRIEKPKSWIKKNTRNVMKRKKKLLIYRSPIGESSCMCYIRLNDQSQMIASDAFVHNCKYWWPSALVLFLWIICLEQFMINYGFSSIFSLNDSDSDSEELISHSTEHLYYKQYKSNAEFQKCMSWHMGKCKIRKTKYEKAAEMSDAIINDQIALFRYPRHASVHSFCFFQW